jgi:hypothetical protein
MQNGAPGLAQRATVGSRVLYSKPPPLPLSWGVQYPSPFLVVLLPKLPTVIRLLLVTSICLDILLTNGRAYDCHL